MLTSQNGTNSTTTTSSNGSFTFPVGSSQLANATITIPVQQNSSSHVVVSNGTVYNCSDTATNQAPPFSLTAQVPANSEFLSPSVEQTYHLLHADLLFECLCSSFTSAQLRGSQMQLSDMVARLIWAAQKRNPQCLLVINGDMHQVTFMHAAKLL